MTFIEIKGLGHFPFNNASRAVMFARDVSALYGSAKTLQPFKNGEVDIGYITIKMGEDIPKLYQRYAVSDFITNEDKGDVGSSMCCLSKADANKTLIDLRKKFPSNTFGLHRVEESTHDENGVVASYFFYDYNDVKIKEEIRSKIFGE